MLPNPLQADYVVVTFKLNIAKFISLQADYVVVPIEIISP